jgi:hypothetical protein
MTFLKLLFDWLVLTPAAVTAYLFACFIGLMLMGIPALVWHWTIRLLEPSSPGLRTYDFPGAPRNLSTGILAGIAALYVFAVAIAAVYQLPRIMFAILNAPD